MSWFLIAALILVYWVVSFVRMRMRGRQEFDRAFERAAAEHVGNESLEIVVTAETRPLRTALVVLVVPIALVVLRFLIAR